MDFKDYYATLGVPATATHDEIRRAYRKLARKFHPDVSKEPNAEARFKEVAEAHEALVDTERRAAYDERARRHAAGESFGDAPEGGGGFDFRRRGAGGGGDGPDIDADDFFESLFGRAARGSQRRGRARSAQPAPGEDVHARVEIELEDAYHGATRTISLRMPQLDAHGRTVLRDKQLEVNIPKGLRSGQQLRLAGQGGPGDAGGPAGDLYLEIAIRPHPRYRVDGRDVSVDLAVAPWEAARGAEIPVQTPGGPLSLTIPPHSRAGRRMRLKGRGLPGTPPGDLYAVLTLALPETNSPAATAAWDALAAAFPDFDARAPRTP